MQVTSNSFMSIPQKLRPRTHAGCGADGQILGPESIENNLSHFVVNGSFHFGVCYRHDQRERLRLKGVLVLDSVAREELHFQSPAVPSFPFGSEIAVVCPHWRPLSELFNLVRLVENPGVLMLRRNKAFERVRDSASVARLLGVVDAEMRIDVGLAVFRPPPPSSGRRESNSHPNLAKVAAISPKRRRVGEIIPFKEVTWAKLVLKDKWRRMRCTFQAVGHLSRKSKA